MTSRRQSGVYSPAVSPKRSRDEQKAAAEEDGAAVATRGVNVLSSVKRVNPLYNPDGGGDDGGDANTDGATDEADTAARDRPFSEGDERLHVVAEDDEFEGFESVDPADVLQDDADEGMMPGFEVFSLDDVEAKTVTLDMKPGRRKAGNRRSAPPSSGDV